MSRRVLSACVSLLALTLLPACGAEPPATLERAVGDHLVSAGQPSAGRLRALKAEVTKVLNLRPEREHPYDEAAVAAQVGLPYVQIGVDKETIADAAVRARIYDVFAEVESADGRLYAHCKSGNRVGALWALYLAERKGVKPAEALAAGKRAGLTRLEPFVRKALNLE